MALLQQESTLSADRVDQSADAADGDMDLILLLQGELIGRNDTCAGKQETAAVKCIVAVEILDQGAKLTLQFGEGGGTGEDRFACAQNLQA